MTDVALSAIDEERFGIRIARANRITVSQLPDILDFCQENAVVMLIARCSTNDIKAAQVMEEHGFRLMDTLVYYACDLKKTPVPEDTGTVLVRPIRPGEEEQVRAVAAAAFKDYFGHYHADDRLDRAKADEAYISWAVRSCASREVADAVYVADWDGRVAGFITLRLNGPDRGEFLLSGVVPEAQGYGIYRSLFIAGMRWCLVQNARQIVISTQVDNIAVQKVWARLGFTMLESFYTFHKWFD